MNFSLKSIIINWNEIQLQEFFVEKNDSKISGEKIICEVSFLDWLLFSELNISKLEVTGLHIKIRPSSSKINNAQKSNPVSFYCPPLTVKSFNLQGQIEATNLYSASFMASAMDIKPNGAGQFTLKIEGNSPEVQSFESNCSGIIRQSNGTVNFLADQKLKLTLVEGATLKDFQDLEIAVKANFNLDDKGVWIDDSFIKLNDSNSEELISVKNSQKILVPWQIDPKYLLQKQGNLLELEVKDLPLSYINPWISPYQLKGRIQTFQIVVSGTGQKLQAETLKSILFQDIAINSSNDVLLPPFSAQIQFGFSAEPAIKKNISFDNFNLNTFRLQCIDSHNQSVLQAQLVQPIQISIRDAKNDILKHKGDLIDIELNHLPLAWGNFWTKPLELTGDLQPLKGSFKIEDSILKWKSINPLKAENIEVMHQNEQLLKKFNCSLIPLVELKDNSLTCALNKIALFAKEDTAWLKGQASVLIEPMVGLKELAGNLTLDLQGISQHPIGQSLRGLSSGTIIAAFGMDAVDQNTKNFNGDLNANNLQTSDKLLLPKTINLTATGTQVNDGLDTKFQVFIDATEGKTPINGTIKCQGSIYDCILASPNIYLDSLLNLSKLSPRENEGKTTAIKDNEEVPFWKHMPAIALKLDVENFIYEKTSAVQKLKGKIRMDHEGISLETLTGTALDAPFEASGDLKYDENKKVPYELMGDLRFSKLNAGKIFERFKRGASSPIEGIFDAKLKVTSESSNMENLSTNLQGEFTLNGQKGCLKVLEAAGQKAQLGTAALGVASIFLGNNENSSLSTASDLVTLLKKIDYDTCEVHLERGTSKNCDLKVFKILGPTLALEAKGQISYQPNIGILDQPLIVEGHLDAAGQAALLMDQLQLLEGKKLQNGYRKGPAFAISGTLAKPDFSDLYGLIMKAGQSLMKGSKSEEPVEPASRTEKAVNAIGSALKGLIGR